TKARDRPASILSVIWWCWPADVKTAFAPAPLAVWPWGGGRALWLAGRAAGPADRSSGESSAGGCLAQARCGGLPTRWPNARTTLRLKKTAGLTETRFAGARA